MNCCQRIEDLKAIGNSRYLNKGNDNVTNLDAQMPTLIVKFVSEGISNG